MTAMNTLSDLELAVCISQLAVMAHPGNPDAAERFALEMVDIVLRPCSREIDALTGPAEGVGPDIETELETAWEAQRDLGDQEAMT